MSVTTKFEESGTLRPPGPIGRLMRLVLGLWILHLFYQLIVFELLAPRASELISWQAPSRWVWWVTILIFFWVFPYVVNIGLSQNWRRKPQGFLLAMAILVGCLGFALHDSLWSPVLGWLVLIWLLYVTAHLGFALVLAAILATPGCEMRAFHHLWTKVTGRETKEHYCPGFFDKLDKWEADRNKSQLKKEITS